MYFRLAFLCIFYFSAFSGHCQLSELYVVDLLKVADRFEITNGRYLSEFNTGGYTNQPAFSDLYTLLVTVGSRQDPLNTDIFELNLRTQQITRLTKTSDREYSPTISKIDPKYITCVVVETENQNNQILWQYPHDRSNGGRPLLQGVNQVGYYSELKDGWVAVFEVDSLNKLWLHNRETGEKKFISANVGRTLHPLKDGSLAFVHKFSKDYWFLKKLNMTTFRSDIIKKTIPGAEDFTLLADDSIIMGSKNKLYRLDFTHENAWEQIADLDRMGIKNITRLAFNGINQLAIVDQQ